MNTILAALLADYVHHWDEDTEEGDKRIDLMEAEQYMTAFVRLFGLEELVEQIARRLFANRYGDLWDETSGTVKNKFMMSAMNALDALKDEMIADSPPSPTLDQILGRSRDMSPAGPKDCAWCGQVIKLQQDVWATVTEEMVCELSPTKMHEPTS